MSPVHSHHQPKCILAVMELMVVIEWCWKTGNGILCLHRFIHSCLMTMLLQTSKPVHSNLPTCLFAYPPLSPLSHYINYALWCQFGQKRHIRKTLINTKSIWQISVGFSAINLCRDNNKSSDWCSMFASPQFTIILPALFIEGTSTVGYYTLYIFDWAQLLYHSRRCSRTSEVCQIAAQYPIAGIKYIITVLHT